MVVASGDWISLSILEQEPLVDHPDLDSLGWGGSSLQHQFYGLLQHQDLLAWDMGHQYTCQRPLAASFSHTCPQSSQGFQS